MTLFEKIIAREIPADIVYEDDLVLAFNDINPLANVHVLIVPREHVTYITGATEQHEALLGHLLRVGARIAIRLGIAEGGYRLAVNQGVDAGQIVDHLHIHMLGGGQLDVLGTPLGPM